MTDFKDEIRRRVQGAREAYQEQREEQKREAQQEAEEQDQRKARAKALLGEVQAKMREAAEGSEGAMRFGGSLTDGIGVNAYDLYWEAPPPKRGLRVSVDYLNGLVAWTWLLRDEVGRTRSDALRFDIRLLDRLILALAEQKAWAEGRAPRI
jgi:hypothetical protein